MIWILGTLVVILLIMMLDKNSTIAGLKSDLNISQRVAIEIQRDLHKAVKDRDTAKKELEAALSFGSLQFKRAFDFHNQLTSAQEDIEKYTVQAMALEEEYETLRNKLAKYDRPRDPKTGKITKKKSK